MLKTGPVVPMSSPAHHASYLHRPRTSRSRSISSSSVVAVQRTASPASAAPTAASTAAATATAHRLDSAQPDESALAIKIPTSNFNRSPSPNPVTARQYRRPEPQINDGVANLNRWSQSTASSSGNLDSPGRRRAPSAHSPAHSRDMSDTNSLWIARKMPASQSEPPQFLEDLSPRSKGIHYEPLGNTSESHRRNAPSLDKPLPPAIPPLTSFHIPSGSFESINASDLFLTTNSFTPSSAGLLTPLSYSAFDYFGNALPVNNDAVKEESSSAAQQRDIRHNPSDPHRRRSSRQPTDRHRNSSHDHAPSDDGSHRRPRTKERRDRDKKTMLSKALEKANTAVLLDNAMNHEGALVAYQDACKLLESVLDKTNGVDDRRKLDAIRDTYAIRIEELLQLQASANPVFEEKSLPPRPMSNESLELAPEFNIEQVTSGDHDHDRDSAIIGTATVTRIIDAPSSVTASTSASASASTTNLPRHSFLTDAIRQVEGTAPGAFLGPLWERSKSPMRESFFSDRTARPNDALEESYMPRPLTPRRSPSDGSQEVEAGGIDAPVSQSSEPTQTQTANQFIDPVSWLNTIDESGSDTSSVHSMRKQPNDVDAAAGDSDVDFDAAFDAAVEAAYEDGYELDPDYDDGPLTSIPQSNGKPPASQGFKSATDTEDDGLDEEAEEERMLDDITKDYINDGFDFDMQSKSALPRQSDSSVLSRSTWQSSVVSNRTTAGTSLSAVPENDNKSQDVSDSASTTQPLQGAEIGADGTSRPLSVISEGARSVQNRRSTGPNFKQLKIETSRKSVEQWVRTPLAAVNDDGLVKDGSIGEHEPDAETSVSTRPISEVPSLRRFQNRYVSPRENKRSSSADYSIYSEQPDSSSTINGTRSPRPALFRKNKSSISLRDNGMLTLEEQSEPIPPTPLSASYLSTYGSHESGLPTARRPYITPSSGSYGGMRDGSISASRLFDTSLTSSSPPSSPTSQEPFSPLPLEPCPESTLLRPFWLLRCIASTINHPRGGFLTTRLFVPREVWKTRSVKLRYLEEKVANCDLLTAALGKLSSADTYDVDVILEELQAFEGVMDRVQMALVRRLGSEVGVQGIGTLFKDAPPTDYSNPVISEGKDGSRTNSGKSYLSGLRKRLNKNSGTSGGGSVSGGSNSAGTGSLASNVRSESQMATMASVPMTSFVSVEKHRLGKHEGSFDHGAFDGPLKEYMSSLSRLAEAAQVLGKPARFFLIIIITITPNPHNHFPLSPPQISFFSSC